MVRAIVLGILLATPVHLHDQWAQVSPRVKHWFESQTVPDGGPSQGQSCCSVSDAEYAEEDIVNGRYWTRWRIQGALTAWQPVPPEAVLNTPNLAGHPVVWYWWKDGIPVIRCFAPASGV